MNWGRTLKNALHSYDLPSEFVKWREMVADRNQWPAVCGFKMPSATKETPTSSRNKAKKERERNTYSQTSRLENPEELQQHHNYEIFLFLTVLFLFAQFKMLYW
jgi:hypothetical protein